MKLSTKREEDTDLVGSRFIVHVEDRRHQRQEQAEQHEKSAACDHNSITSDSKEATRRMRTKLFQGRRLPQQNEPKKTVMGTRKFPVAEVIRNNERRRETSTNPTRLEGTAPFCFPARRTRLFKHRTRASL
jgi:hypothetical protein